MVLDVDFEKSNLLIMEWIEVKVNILTKDIIGITEHLTTADQNVDIVFIGLPYSGIGFS